MTDAIHITGQATLSCQCGEFLSFHVLRVELHDLTEHLEQRAEDHHGWGSCGHCPGCQAPLDADAAQVEKADASRKEEATA